MPKIFKFINVIRNEENNLLNEINSIKNGDLFYKKTWNIFLSKKILKNIMIDMMKRSIKLIYYQK